MSSCCCCLRSFSFFFCSSQLQSCQKGGPSHSNKKKTPLEVETFFKDRLEITDKKVIQKVPEDRTVEDLESFALLFEESVGVTSTEVRAMIQKHPGVLTLTAEKHLEPRIKWLEERVGLDKAQRRNVVKRHERVLTCSIEKNLEKIKWLEDAFGLNRVHVGEMTVRQPSSFAKSVDNNLLPTFEFCKNAVGEQSAISLVIKCPSMLELGLESRLKPRLKEA